MSTESDTTTGTPARWMRWRRSKRSSRRFVRRRPSRRPSTGSGPRSDSGCCHPEPACRPSASSARSSGSRARPCARRWSRWGRAGTCGDPRTRRRDLRRRRCRRRRRRRDDVLDRWRDAVGPPDRCRGRNRRVRLPARAAGGPRRALSELLTAMDASLDDFSTYRQLDVRFHLGAGRDDREHAPDHDRDRGAGRDARG